MSTAFQEYESFVIIESFIQRRDWIDSKPSNKIEILDHKDMDELFLVIACFIQHTSKENYNK